MVTAAAVVYTSDPIEGWVVDAETGKPLEGVVLVAHWPLKGGLDGGTIQELQILESVTDRNGHYAFPGWGPKFALIGHLRSSYPGILVFKEGYEFQRLFSDFYNRDTSRSDWDKKTIKLKRFTGALADYPQQLFLLNTELWNAGYSVGYSLGDFCGWKSFPNMLKALDKLDERLIPLRPTNRSVVWQLRSNDARLRAKGCGTVEELIGK